MGFPIRKAVGRAGLIAAMLGGGLLYAGISQAEEVGAQAVATQQERGAELTAATGGPASQAHLIAFTQDTAAVDTREDDVADEPTPVMVTPARIASGVAAKPAAAVHDSPVKHQTVPPSPSAR